MKLADATSATLFEAAYFGAAYHEATYHETTNEATISEADIGPRWSFPYPPWKHDPTPDVLVLGSYVHPSTRNELVGGINLRYLDDAQRKNLARMLPKIMQPSNLYGRYWAGRRLIPDVFKSYYRTYRSDHMRDIARGVMHPKYGVAKTARKWLSNKIQNLFRSPAQKAAADVPQYPDDISNLQHSIDQRLQATPGVGQPSEPVPDEPQPVDDMSSAADPLMPQPGPPQPNQLQPSQSQPYQSQQPSQPQSNPSQLNPSLPQPNPPQPDPQRARAALDNVIAKNRAELFDPSNEVDLDEAVVYYSPVAGKLLVENLQLTLASRLRKLRESLVAVVQDEYDMWDNDEHDLGGGICDLVAERIADILGEYGIDNTMGGHAGDDHAFCIAYDAAQAYVVDVPPYLYKLGAGYVWTKLPDVQFTADDIMIYRCDYPDWLDD